jgi:hypothetical protein
VSDIHITRIEEHYGYNVTWGALAYSGKVQEGTERIVSIQNFEASVSLGQLVTANGRFGATRGARGLVIKLHVPNTEGRTTDIIDCLFEAVMREPRMIIMKFKDLDF